MERRTADRRRQDSATRPTELGGFERGLQRACGIGLVAFVLQALAVVVAGYQLYPLWWFLGPGPAMFAAISATAAACLRGRSTTSGRMVVVTICAIGCVLTGVAIASTVQSAGSVLVPFVVGLVGLIGLLDRPVLGVPAGLALIGSHMVSAAASRPLEPADTVVATFIQCAFLVAASAGGWLARRFAATQDRTNVRLTQALLADRAAAASRSDRREQERELHDTVLSTLTALARSSLTGSEQVRARCAADARYLRALRERAKEIPGPGLDLPAELHAIARDVSADGFQVTVDAHGTSVPLPGPVVRALTRAAREAVANAARHSGAGRGEVFLRHSDTCVTVEVVDHGHGHIPLAGHDGLGVHRSIGERMADVGGRASVRHDPGVGTRVVLTWPR